MQQPIKIAVHCFVHGRLELNRVVLAGKTEAHWRLRFSFRYFNESRNIEWLCLLRLECCRLYLGWWCWLVLRLVLSLCLLLGLYLLLRLDLLLGIYLGQGLHNLGRLLLVLKLVGHWLLEHRGVGHLLTNISSGRLGHISYLVRFGWLLGLLLSNRVILNYLLRLRWLLLDIRLLNLSNWLPWILICRHLNVNYLRVLGLQGLLHSLGDLLHSLVRRRRLLLGLLYIPCLLRLLLDVLLGGLILNRKLLGGLILSRLLLTGLKLSRLLLANILMLAYWLFLGLHRLRLVVPLRWLGCCLRGMPLLGYLIVILLFWFLISLRLVLLLTFLPRLAPLFPLDVVKVAKPTGPHGHQRNGF